MQFSERNTDAAPPRSHQTLAIDGGMTGCSPIKF
jgi:hypothetical protein